MAKNELKLKHYVDSLKILNKKNIKMNVLRSRNHEIFSEEVCKTALSANDEKQKILEDGISTRAWGHWRDN